MGGLSAAAASRKPSSLQRKKRAFRVACTCFFWNTRKAIIIAKRPGTTSFPSRMQRKEHGGLPFSRT
jgi:hypothetical protein